MPVVDITHHPDKSTTAVWEITETEKKLLRDAALSGNEQEELQRITNPQRRLERLAVCALLNRIMNKKTSLSHHSNGQPFLPGSTARISITHTQQFAAIIYHEQAAVGIDIEALSRNFSAVEQKALSDKEREYLIGQYRQQQLCLLWCAKETMYKLIGKNGIDFAGQLFIEKFTPQHKGQLTAIYTGNNGRETILTLNYQQIDEHMMVWGITDNLLT